MRLSNYQGQARASRLKEAIEHTIHTRGLHEFNLLAQKALNEPCSDPEIVPSLTEFWSRTKNDFNHHIHILQNFILNIPNYSFSRFLRDTRVALPQSMGFLISFSLSQIDLRFQVARSKTQAIYMHRPFVVWTRLTLDWLTQIIRLSSESPKLSARDRSFLVAILDHLIEIKQGYERGVYRKEFMLKLLRACQLSSKQGSINVTVDPSFFGWLVSQLDYLHRTKPPV